VREYSAGGIVFYGDKVLVLQNRRGDNVFPKGHVEEGETVAEAALREVEEESGVKASIVVPLGTTEYKFFWPEERNWRVKLVSWFLMETDHDHVRGDGLEIVSGRFADVSDVAGLLTYDLDRETLKTAVQELKKHRS
jgi:8-oxo-dGTP pyrophosphatase MutT (NUDIX family)